MEKEKAMRTHKGAGYTLHEEVRKPTPALLRASQIGVLSYDEPSLAAQEDKDALLVVSYGAARKEAREAAVEPLMEAISEANPETDIFEAYTSSIMRAKAKESAGVEILSAEEALGALLQAGYTRVAIASLHLFPGAEYVGLVELFNACKKKFKRLVLGAPLMYWMGQEEQRDDAADLTKALRESLPPQAEDEAVLVMAHGTQHPSNSFYAALQTRFEMAGWDRAFVYTLAGWPRLEHITPILKEKGIRAVASCSTREARMPPGTWRGTPPAPIVRSFWPRVSRLKSSKKDWASFPPCGSFMWSAPTRPGTSCASDDFVGASLRRT